jgi:L-ascorbate metabolism protein UlaG (beta-lactamase superfamily)
VVIDFPFSGTFDWCISPTEAQIQALLKREAPFEQVDAFVFTHDHVDHFDPTLVARCLAVRPEMALVGTTRVLQRVREAAGAPLSDLVFEARAGEPIQLKDLRILPLKAPHARYWDIDPVTKQRVTFDDGYIHSAYRITLGGFSFLHGGDAHQISLPPGTTADLLLLDRGVVRGLGLPALKELHQRLGARHTALIHLGPAEGVSMQAAIQSESAWLSAFTGRNLTISLPLKGSVTVQPSTTTALREALERGGVTDLRVRFRKLQQEQATFSEAELNALAYQQPQDGDLYWVSTDHIRGLKPKS